jgi:GntR family transcriptional regulator, galactonate operon transcriptional repressor
MTNVDAHALRGGRLRKRNLFSHVVEEIGSRIVSGQFGPGAALPNEAELGQEFSASRSVIREAVKSLAAKGLLESRTRTGIRALTPIHWNLLDPEVLAWRYSSMQPGQFFREIFEIRGMIEPQAAALAAERAGDAEIAEIAAAYAAMEAAEGPGNSAIQADLRFHRAVLAGAHNDLLLQMGNLIGVGLLVSYRLSSDSFTVFLPLHRDVLAAIEAHRADAARAAMARLLSDTRTFLHDRLDGADEPAAKAEKPKARLRVPA